MITYERLRDVLDYDEETGLFTWTNPPGYKTVPGASAGSETKRGYVCIQIDGIKYKAHRLAWLYSKGYMTENEIDHINRIKNDNRICNLREVSRQCNVVNRGEQKNNTSGVIGVYRYKATGKWGACITITKSRKHLGFFNSKIDASMARYNAEIDYKFYKCNTISSAYQYLKKHGAI